MFYFMFQSFLTLAFVASTADALYSPESRWSMPRSDHGVPIDLHIVFVTDCTAHQKWMAFNVFNSARAVGQEDPITWVRSGCTEQQNSKDNSLAQSLYPKAAVRSVGGDDGKGEHDFNLAFGVPKAVQGFVKTAEGMSNSSVLALIEADFVFLSKLRLDDLTTRGLPMNRDSLIEVNGLHVGGKVPWRSTTNAAIILGRLISYQLKVGGSSLRFGLHAAQLTRTAAGVATSKVLLRRRVEPV